MCGEGPERRRDRALGPGPLSFGRAYRQRTDPTTAPNVRELLGGNKMSTGSRNQAQEGRAKKAEIKAIRG
jgi:hypothetical protein